VCHSLSEAESCGLVHRDIKPANIFVCRYGEEYDFVKVLDFGIVGAVRTTADSPVIQTGENQVQGTPAFMAPEQAMGTPIDARADIYATGCLAYWLLTGEFVFAADTPMGHIVHHVHTLPSPPSARTERAMPAGLDELVLACLAKDPRDRPQTARELSRRLGELSGAETWSQERAREWWLTHQRDTTSSGPAGVAGGVVPSTG
jgi:eukaryotic-like serine/threonine-protein kinase